MYDSIILRVDRPAAFGNDQVCTMSNIFEL